MNETVIARYDLTNLVLAALLLIFGYPALVFGAPLIVHESYQAFFESTRYAYGWIVLILLAPYSALIGGLVVADATRARGVAIAVRGGDLVFGGPWRVVVPLDRIDKVEIGRKPYGVRVWWDGSRERGFNTILMRPRREDIREAIFAALPERPVA